MAPANPPKPQDGQAMTADEREEAQLTRALEYLNVLHVWVCAAHPPAPHVKPRPLTPFQVFRTPGYDPKNDRAAEYCSRL